MVTSFPNTISNWYRCDGNINWPHCLTEGVHSFVWNDNSIIKLEYVLLEYIVTTNTMHKYPPHFYAFKKWGLTCHLPVLMMVQDAPSLINSLCSSLGQTVAYKRRMHTIVYSASSLIQTSIILTPKVTVLLEYSGITVHSIRVNVTIALYETQWASVIWPISLIWIFLAHFRNKGAWITGI